VERVVEVDRPDPARGMTDSGHVATAATGVGGLLWRAVRQALYRRSGDRGHL